MDIQKLSESLSPNEWKILPYLEDSLINICKRANLDKVSVLRALEYLQNKKIVELSSEKKKVVEIGVNGALYQRKGLPERRFLNVLNEKRILTFEEAQKQSKLSDEEFKVSIGVLRKKALIDIKNGKIILGSNREEIAKKSLEEQFLEKLPIEYDSLSLEQLSVLKNLQGRRDIIQIKEQKKINIKITNLGKILIDSKLKSEDLIEQITPALLKKESFWKGKKFRRYDVTSSVPEISGGKRHFVNQALDYARRVWTEMGFQEMKSDFIINSFWNFDSLFTAQDHPVRDMQDTFFINKEGALPDKNLVKSVKKAHEEGVGGSKGWGYKWDEEMAKKMVLRTHTTALSSQTLAKLQLKNLPQKFFSLGKCFRNETVDWNHSFEFNQTEGIVVDENANFRHLLGYLKEFANKMGYKKVRFRPSYFPYTEPSLEGDVWNEERKEWVEVFAAGIFRPEVTEPLLGKPIPVLAWGPGFDRMIMNIFGIKDMRDLYKNDLTQLRKIGFLMK